MSECTHAWRTTTSNNWRECETCHFVQHFKDNEWIAVTTLPVKKKLTEQEKLEKLHKDLSRAKQQMDNFSKRASTLLSKQPEFPQLPVSFTDKTTIAYCKQVNSYLQQLIKQYDEIKWFLAAIDSFFAIYLEKEEEHGTNSEQSL